MTFKTLFGLTIVPASVLGGILLACVSKRIRDVYFVALVFFSPMIERLDVNFVSREWYRGTSRGFEFSVLDVLSIGLLAGQVLCPRKGESRGYWPAGLGIMLIFFFYAVFNVAISEPRLFGLFELFKMFRGFILVLAVAYYVRSERELRLYIGALGALVAYECLLALKQRYVDGVHRVYGTIDDSNSLSVFLCLTAPVFVAVINARVPKHLKALGWSVLPLATVGVVLTISRAGVAILGLTFAVAALVTVSYRITARRVCIALLVMLGVAGVAAKSWKTVASRFQAASLKEEYEDKHSMGRGYYIRIANAIAADRVFGVGLNNWSYWASNEYGPKLGFRFVPYRGVDREPSTVIPSGRNIDEAQAAPAHSLGALTLGELGIPGLVLFAMVWLRWFSMGAGFLWPRTPLAVRRVGVGILFGFLGIFLQSITEWVFRQLPISYVFNVMLGVLMALCQMKRVSRAERPAPALEAVEMGAAFR